MLKDVKNFKGVFMQNMLDKKIGEDESGVINYDKMIGGNGTHWVAYYNSPDNPHVYFFDSFGCIPSDEIQQYLHSSGKLIKFDSKDIQNVASVMCGWYCVAWIKQMANGMRYEDWADEWKDNGSIANEKKIKKMFS